MRVISYTSEKLMERKRHLRLLTLRQRKAIYAAKDHLHSLLAVIKWIILCPGLSR